MISFENNNHDILSNLFSSLSYDLQEKIYNETLIIQEFENNKRYFSEYILREIQYYGNQHKERLNNLYQYLDCGKRIIREDEEEYCVECDIIHDELYYENLDFILKCDINTEIDFENNELNFTLKLKDCYSFVKQYYDNIIENENDFKMSYKINTHSYHLYDFLMYDIIVDIDYQELFEEFDNLVETRDNEKIKILLYKATNRKIFYGKLEKYENIMLF